MAEHISLPWANEVPPESAWSTLRHKAAALKCSPRRCELSFLSSLPSSSHHRHSLPSFVFLVSSFFIVGLLISKLCLAPCVTVTLSLSWDPFDVVGHNEIPLYLGQFSVWRLILHEPISRAFRHTRTHKTGCTHTPIHHQTNPTVPPIEKKTSLRGHTYTQRGHPYSAVLPRRQGKRREASWLLSFRSRIICWEGGSGRFGCVDN